MPTGLSAWQAAAKDQAATLSGAGAEPGNVEALEVLTRRGNGRVQLAAEDRAYGDNEWRQVWIVRGRVTLSDSQPDWALLDVDCNVLDEPPAMAGRKRCGFEHVSTYVIDE